MNFFFVQEKLLNYFQDNSSKPKFAKLALKDFIKEKFPQDNSATSSSIFDEKLNEDYNTVNNFGISLRDNYRHLSGKENLHSASNDIFKLQRNENFANDHCISSKYNFLNEHSAKSSPRSNLSVESVSIKSRSSSGFGNQIVPSNNCKPSLTNRERGLANGTSFSLKKDNYFVKEEVRDTPKFEFIQRDRDPDKKSENFETSAGVDSSSIWETKPGGKTKIHEICQVFGETPKRRLSKSLGTFSTAARQFESNLKIENQRRDSPPRSLRVQDQIQKFEAYDHFQGKKPVVTPEKSASFSVVADNPMQKFFERKLSVTNIQDFKANPFSLANDTESSAVKSCNYASKSQNIERPPSVDHSAGSSSDFLTPRSQFSTPRFEEHSYSGSKAKKSESSSGSTECIISDRESLTDQGEVNLKTVIRIKKKSKSSPLVTEESKNTFVRNFEPRRSLRPINNESKLKTDIVPGKIKVSIAPKAKTGDVLPNHSRMFVKQSDAQNRNAKVSSFNVRETIEKRAIEKERKERRALRKKIKDQIRSQYLDSSDSEDSSVYVSCCSVRSKSLSSLDQDLDDFRCESPLVKVHSTPTLEKEKKYTSDYLFGSNLIDISPGVSSSFKNNSPRTSYKSFGASQSKNITQGDYKLGSSNLHETRSNFSHDSSNLSSRLQSLSSRTASPCLSSSLVAKVMSDVSSNRSRLSQYQLSTDKYSQSEFSEPYKSSIRARSLDERPLTDTQKWSMINSNNYNSIDQHKEDISLNNNKHSENGRTPQEPRSASQILSEEKNDPLPVRFAKERRSLREKDLMLEPFSDRDSSIVSGEPAWIQRARKKLESLNIPICSTTEIGSVCSGQTESSSAWSRGGLDALTDLREESYRISLALKREAESRVLKDLKLISQQSKMLEPATSSQPQLALCDRSNKVSFDATAENSTEEMCSRVTFGASTEGTKGSNTHNEEKSSGRKLSSRYLRNSKEEVRFGDLKRDFGDKQKTQKREARFSDLKLTDDSDSNHREFQPNLPKMLFGDSPNDLASRKSSESKSSSKFESVSGPDPTTMSAEQLNQNVEEYDFPIPRDHDSPEEIMRFVEEEAKKELVAPQIISDVQTLEKVKPKSILKRRSSENVSLTLTTEEKLKRDRRKSSPEGWVLPGKMNLHGPLHLRK